MNVLDADARLRPATLGDLDAVLAIKRALPMPTRARTAAGGFLLGVDPDVYAQLLVVGHAWLLEIDGRPVGFSLTLSDAILRRSPIWARRAEIAWSAEFDPDTWLTGRVGYFDQLAVLPELVARYWGASLAQRALTELMFEHNHPLVLTTTVVEPIVNAAALPYLARVGARTVGRIAEHYPNVGPIVSAVHAIEADRCRARLADHGFGGEPIAR